MTFPDLKWNYYPLTYCIGTHNICVMQIPPIDNKDIVKQKKMKIIKVKTKFYDFTGIEDISSDIFPLPLMP